MTEVNLYLVRHGRAAAGFDSHHDPDLDDLGREQAEAVARQLNDSLEALPIISSPIARARQTAQPLSRCWQQEMVIEPAISEIPSPTTDLAARAAWLGEAMQGDWTALPAPQRAFRETLIQRLLTAEQDQVLFSHFVAINLAVGAALDDPRMVIFRPDNTSITHLKVRAGQLEVVTLGSEAITRVN